MLLRAQTRALLAPILTLLLLSVPSTSAQEEEMYEYDLLLKGGHAIDPRHEIDGVMDVAIADAVIAAVADVTVMSLREGSFGCVDVRNRRLDGSQQLRAELTLRAGDQAWDLNGLTARPWDED